MTREDPLIERYREANALDPARPSASVRENVLARARAAAKTPVGEARPAAANDAFWRWRALGGLAVLGLATMVVLQFDRGTPEERDSVLAPAAPRATVPATAPSAAPSPSPSATPAPAPAAPPVSATPPPRPAPPAAAKPAPPPPPPEARSRSAESVAPAPAQAPAVPDPPAAPALRAPSAPAPARAQDNTADAMSESATAARSQARPEAQGALAREVDVNAVDAQGRTALMRAALQGDTARVRRLLDAGADPGRRDREGRSAADLAREAGHAAVLSILEAASAAPR